MSTRRESRVTGRFEVLDQRGQQHIITQRTDFIYVTYLDGTSPPPEPGLSEYLMEGRHVNKLDDHSFETPDGLLQLRRP